MPYLKEQILSRVREGKTIPAPTDIDKNGKVDIFDYNQLVANFGKRI